MSESKDEEKLTAEIKYPDACSITLGLVIPRDYGYLLEEGTAGLLEEAERNMVTAVLHAADHYDTKSQALLAIDPGLYETLKGLEKELAEAFEVILERSADLRNLDLPTFLQPDPESEPLVQCTFHFGNKDAYLVLLQDHGYAAFLAKYSIEMQTLNILSDAWSDLYDERRSLGLEGDTPVHHNPYLATKKTLHNRLADFVADRIQEISPTGDTFDWGNPQTPAEARKQVLEKALSHDMPFALIVKKKDGSTGSTYKETIIHTVDTKTGITFITKQGFMKKTDKSDFELWGTIGISGFGPDGEIFYLTPEYRAPEYSTKQGEKNWESFKPFFRGEGTYSGIAPLLSKKRQMEIWEAYCRAVCDVEASKKELKSRTDWEYTLAEVSWGKDEEAMDAFIAYQKQERIAELEKSAIISDLSRIRLGIRSGSDIPVPEYSTSQKLMELQKYFTRYTRDPQESPFWVDKEDPKQQGYASFRIPVGDWLGVGVNIRLIPSESGGGILLTDAPMADENIARRRYMSVSWNNDGKWYIQRGWLVDPGDAYFLYPDTKGSEDITGNDIQTVLLALMQL